MNCGPTISIITALARPNRIPIQQSVISSTAAAHIKGQCEGSAAQGDSVMAHTGKLLIVGATAAIAMLIVANLDGASRARHS